MKSVRLAVAAAALAVVALALPSRAATTVAVQASNFRFCPDAATPCLPTNGTDTRTVQLGDTVRWVYKDTACDAVALCPGHNVTFADGAHGSNVKAQNAVLFTRTFTTAGTYNYTCTIHAGNGMLGVVVVQGAAATTTTTGSTSTTAAAAGKGASGTLAATGGRSAPALTAVALVLLVIGLAVEGASRRAHARS